VQDQDGHMLDEYNYLRNETNSLYPNCRNEKC